LCEVVVESDVAAPAARFVVGPTGDRGQEDPGGSRVSAQESGQLKAVQHRHAQIDEANVRRELECLCQSFWAAVGNPRVVAPRPDELDQAVGGVFVVFDAECATREHVHGPSSVTAGWASGLGISNDGPTWPGAGSPGYGMRQRVAKPGATALREAGPQVA